MSQKQDSDYQDPILTPGSLRKIVENLPGKAKHEHGEYEYNCDSDTFENEINDFFSYTEVTVSLQEYRRLYEKEYVEITRQDILSLLDKLDSSDRDCRMRSCKLLIYISLGQFTTSTKESRQKRMGNVIRNNNILIECGAFHLFYQRLRQACINSVLEIDFYLTLLYVLLETQRFQYPTKSSEKFKQEIIAMEPNLTEFLFTFVASLRDKLDGSYPIKKIVLLLWKSLLFMSGGLKDIKLLTHRAKQSLGLTVDNSQTIKSTPQDLYHFQNESTEKYPAYEPPCLPLPCPSPSLTVNPSSSSLPKSMGYLNATNQIELLYQTLFPPKSAASVGFPKKQNNQLYNYFLYPPHASPALVLPLVHQGSSVPQGVKEAGQAFVSHMHISLSNYQMIQEKSNAIQKWKRISSSKNESQKIEIMQDEETDLIERLYAKIIPDLQNIIIVLLKLLLTAVATTVDNNDSEQNITLEYLEQVDVARNREVYSKAISGILLILLKWTKSSHVLKFEYLSQLLADSGCLLLILKMIGLQEITDLVKAHTDVPYYNFFDYNINREPETVINTKKDDSYTNHRNMFWTINYLRILLMLTKYKTHRIMLLVQYKSSAILKRILKISHPVLEQYILKLLKSQVPYLGRKWRSQNMKIISAIYLNCHTLLKDDWISKINFEEDLQEGKMQENSLRILTLVYNGERYLPSLLPLHDEVNTQHGSVPTGPGLEGFNQYEMDLLDDEEDIELEPAFMENYQDWLQTEVFNETLVQDVPAPLTPYPASRAPVSHEELALEMNKIYVEQLNSEFKPRHPIQVDIPSAVHAEQPPVSKKMTPLARYNGDKSSLTYGKSDRDKNEPIDNEDEFICKLLQIEDKTIQKWNDHQNGSCDQYHYRLMDGLFDEELYYSG
ncbi:uncharacterized protein EV154DRAFT_527802 [Mucor mucedo]|uniref:uncharacterized protein n=1 Tax=Mucor mucedo TaxID=29922 RepID=UPI00221F1B9D|nr:uncharacterized protein EV154DRAFT_527802 [Mucor mucedo]KAI7873710.1 hypothetical protein EV154DRAFT_527802 [Mucor mucedo]